MADLRGVVLPIIRNILTPPGVDEGEFSERTREHIAKAWKMNVEEVKEQHAYWYDRWCWDTGTPEDRAIYMVYESFIKHRNQMSTTARDLIGVQPMTASVGKIFNIKHRYKKNTEEE